MSQDTARAELDRLIAERRTNYAALSKLLGRNAAYIQQYMRRGRPAVLTERDRRLVADFLGVDERRLDPDAASKPARDDMVVVPRLDVRASAGPGALADLELKLGHYGFDRAWLQRMSAGKPDNLSVVRVDGDSMAPTLLDGDDILVERWQPGDRLRDGIYVLHRDDALLVKRLVLRPAPGRLDIVSDNPAYPSWPDCDAREIQVIGRVIWAGRRLG